MAKAKKANLKWTFSIKETKELAVHPKSNLITWSVSGVATSPEGDDSFFIATNNLDPRYPDRFKVNWNGKNPRMPKPTGHGVADEVKAAAHNVSEGFLLSRGARIAIARQCKLLLGHKLIPVTEAVETTLTLAKS